MNKQLEQSGVNFTYYAPNYLLLGFAAVVIACLLGGMVAAFNSQSKLLSLIFLFSAVGIVIFSYIHLRESKKFAVGSDNKNLDWEIVAADYQRDKVICEVGALARILEINDDQMSDLVSAYIVAEDLALRQIQQEAKVPLVRHISLGGVAFDAIMVKKDLITCVEVSFLVTPNIKQEKINTILRKVYAMKDVLEQMRSDSKISLLLVLVTQFDQTEKTELLSSLENKFKKGEVALVLSDSNLVSLPIPFETELLDFETLQKNYAME